MAAGSTHPEPVARAEPSSGPERHSGPEPGRRDGGDILWHASPPPATTFAERLAAAAGAGFRGISVSPTDARSDDDDTLPPEQMAEQAEAAGVRLHTLDSIIEWYPHVPSTRLLVPDDHDVAGLLALCGRFGVTSVSALAPFPATVDLDGLTACFAAVCDAAAEYGLRVHLEFTPFPPVPDLATAWQVVRSAGRANGGIEIDTWHYFGSGGDLDTLASIPAGTITAVQLSDGATGFRESLLKDTFRHRLLPGQGSFALGDALRLLAGRGELSLAGPEVLSEDLFALGPDQAARLAAQAVDTLFDRP